MRRKILLAGLGLMVLAAMLVPALALAAPDAKDDKQPEYAFDLPLAGQKEHMSFKELKDSGKPFVLFFWISECPHCKRQLPFVELMYRNMQQYKMDVQVLTVNCDKLEDMALESIAQRGITAPVLWDPDVAQTGYSAFEMKEKGTPTTWIFGPGGKYIEDFDSFNSSYMVYVLDKLGVELPKELQYLKKQD